MSSPSCGSRIANRSLSVSQCVIRADCTVCDHMPGTAQIAISSMSSSAWMPVRCPLPPSTPTKSAVSRVPKLSSPLPRRSQPPCVSTGNSAGFALRPLPRTARTSCDELASVLSMLCGLSAVVAAVNRTGPSVSCTRLPASSVNCAATMASTRDSRSVSNSEWSNGWLSVTTSPAMPVTVRGIRWVPSSAWTWAPTYSREAPPTRNVLTVLSGLVRRTLRIAKPWAQRCMLVVPPARVSVNCDRVTGVGRRDLGDGVHLQPGVAREHPERRGDPRAQAAGRLDHERGAVLARPPPPAG